jgi:hypothetical protein
VPYAIQIVSEPTGSMGEPKTRQCRAPQIAPVKATLPGRPKPAGLDRHVSADRFKSVWESLISILLDGNTEAAFSAELVTAVSTEIGMGFVPISICWHAMNNNLIPGIALRAVLFKGAGNFVWIVAHCCSPSF